MNKLKNDSPAAERFYGLHFAPGLAEYQYPDGSKRVYISESTAKAMNNSFEGKPLYVDHIDEVTDKTFQEAAGYVVKSFYNEADGHHWAEFLVTTNEGKDAIKRGLQLSNAYFPTEKGQGGEWHGMDYEEEILDAEYEHLAIVGNPRYAESVIYTPEEFKKYNEDKKVELGILMNQKEKKEMKFNIFKKEKVKNSEEHAGYVYELPKSKVEVTIEEMVAISDLVKVKNADDYEVSYEEMVNVDGESVSVEKLVECYKASTDMVVEEDAAMENEDDDKDKDDKAENMDEDDKTENMEDEDKSENEDEVEVEVEIEDEDDDEDKKENTIKSLKDASRKISKVERKTIDLMHNKIGRGNARYGS